MNITYSATRYFRGLEPVTKKFFAPIDAPAADLIHRAAKAHKKRRGRIIPTRWPACSVFPHGRLIVHTEPVPPPDPARATDAEIHQAASLYRLALEAHRDANHADPVRAARLAAATGDLYLAPVLTYLATYGPTYHATEPPRARLFQASPKATRRQLVQAAKTLLRINGVALRNTSEFLKPPRITSEGVGMTLTITPAPLRPEDISDDEV